MFEPSGALSISSFEYPMAGDNCSREKSDPQQPLGAAELFSVEASDGLQQDVAGFIPEFMVPSFATFP